MNESELFWLCATCWNKKHNPPDEFDWTKVIMACFRCEECGSDPIVFCHPDLPGEENE